MQKLQASQHGGAAEGGAPISRRDLLTGAAVAVGGMALAGTFVGVPAAQAQAEPDDLTAARYELTIDGHSVATFDSLELISSEVPSTLKRLPGKRTPPTVTLKRGATRNIELAAWHELVLLDPQSAIKSVSLTMYTLEGDPVMRYHLTNAWPSKVEIGALKAGASEVLQETLTLVADFIQRVAV